MAAGVEVWLETHGDFATGVATRSLLEEAGSEGLGAVWDPANAFSEFGEEPEAGAAALGPFLRHVHLKDARRPPDGKVPGPPPSPAAATSRPSACLEWLTAADEDRWVSFEWEKRWHPEIEEPEVALPHFLRWAADQLRGRRATERTGARVLTCARLRVEVLPSRPMMGLAAARTSSEAIRDLLARDGRAAVIFASAPSQNEFLAALRQEPGIDWPRITAFHLDEYVGIAPDHPASFRRFLVDRLFDHVKVAAFHGLDGQATDLAAECSRYAALLRQQAPALAILGIGENGHLAFIDPPVCDFAERADVRVVELDEPCRRQQVNDGCFPSLAEVPRTALSLTVPSPDASPARGGDRPGPGQARGHRRGPPGPGHDRLPRVDPPPAPRRDALPRRGLGRRARLTRGTTMDPCLPPSPSCPVRAPALAVGGGATVAEPSLVELLTSAGEYVLAYEDAFRVVVAEEVYVQRLRASPGGPVQQTRRLPRTWPSSAFPAPPCPGGSCATSTRRTAGW